MRTVLMMPENEPMFRLLLDAIQQTKDQPHTPREAALRDLTFEVYVEFINNITFPEITSDELEEWLVWWLDKYDQVFGDQIIILPDQSL